MMQGGSVVTEAIIQSDKMVSGSMFAHWNVDYVIRKWHNKTWGDVRWKNHLTLPPLAHSQTLWGEETPAWKEGNKKMRHQQKYRQTTPHSWLAESFHFIHKVKFPLLFLLTALIFHWPPFLSPLPPLFLGEGGRAWPLYWREAPFWAWPAALIGSEAAALVPPHCQGPEDAPGVSGFNIKRKMSTVHEHTNNPKRD